MVRSSMAALGVLLAIAGGAAAKDKDAEEPALPRDNTGRFVIEEIVSADGVSAQDLYTRARQWATRDYLAKVVVQVDDPKARRLIVRGRFDVPVVLTASVAVWHTLTIEAKDGRYRYELTNFQVVAGDPAHAERESLERYSFKRVQKGTAELAFETVGALKGAMSAPPRQEW